MKSKHTAMARITSYVPHVLRVVSHIVIILIIVQAVTGMLLSLHYVPSVTAATVLDKPATIVKANETIVGVGPKGLLDTPLTPLADTLAVAGEYVLVPANATSVVPSVAGASVNLTIEHHVAGGSVVRAIHHINTSVLIIAALILLVLLVVHRGWLTERLLWVVVIVGILVLLASAFTGRLLPDDVYSHVSALIVRHELSEFPFGALLVTVLGLDTPDSSRLSTPYAIHALFLPSVLAVGVCLLWRRFGAPATNAIFQCVVLVTFFAVLSLGAKPYYPVRDVSGSVQQPFSVEPWWPFVVPNALVSWLGGELAGYLMVASLFALLLLPLYLRSSPSDN